MLNDIYITPWINTFRQNSLPMKNIDWRIFENRVCEEHRLKDVIAQQAAFDSFHWFVCNLSLIFYYFFYIVIIIDLSTTLFYINWSSVQIYVFLIKRPSCSMLATTWEVWHYMPGKGSTLPLLSVKCSTWGDNRIRDLLIFLWSQI
jgi:hypothetical protein